MNPEANDPGKMFHPAAAACFTVWAGGRDLMLSKRLSTDELEELLFRERLYAELPGLFEL